MEDRRPKTNQQIFIGSRSDVVCHKHPGHKQSPGVCSICLGDKLAQLPAISSVHTAKKAKTIASCSSSVSSSCSSLEGSPVHQKYRMGSMKHATMSGILKGVREDVFRKSKSLAAIERVRRKEGEEKERKTKKKGFWSKLLKPKRKNNAELVQPNMVTNGDGKVVKDHKRCKGWIK